MADIDVIDIEQNYEIIAYIAEGTYGKVYSVRKNGQVYALKMCLVSTDVISPGVLHETSVLQNIEHDSLIKVCDIFIGMYDKKKYICILLEYFGKSIRQSKKIENESADTIYMSLLIGVSHLHAQGFYHGDLSHANILIDEHRNVKLIDYNLSSRIYRNDIDNLLGPTVIVRPYELFKQQTIVNYDSRVIDSWSIGCILFYLLEKGNIININDDQKQYGVLREYLKNDLGELINNKSFSNKYKAHLEMLLNLSPIDRILPCDLINLKIKSAIYKQKKLYNVNKNLSNEIIKVICSRLLNYDMYISDEILFLTIVNIKRLNPIVSKITIANWDIYAAMIYVLSTEIISTDYYEIDHVEKLPEFVCWTVEELVNFQLEICSNLEWNIDCTTAYNYIIYFENRFKNYYKILLFIMNNNIQFNDYCEYCKAKAAYTILQKEFGIHNEIFENKCWDKNCKDAVENTVSLLYENLNIDNTLVRIIEYYKMTNICSWLTMIINSKKNEI